MKVIFLDFNGVLDTYYNKNKIDYENFERVRYIIDRTGATVVLTSSLKDEYMKTGNLNQLLIDLHYKFASIGIQLKYTPSLGNREEEIRTYLESHPEIEEYVILDDDYNMVSFGEAMIKLDTQSPMYQCGLKNEHVAHAIKVLNKNEKVLRR